MKGERPLVGDVLRGNIGSPDKRVPRALCPNGNWGSTETLGRTSPTSPTTIPGGCSLRFAGSLGVVSGMALEQACGITRFLPPTSVIQSDLPRVGPVLLYHRS